MGLFFTNLHQEILFTRCGEEVDCTQVKSEIKTTSNETETFFKSKDAILKMNPFLLTLKLVSLYCV